MVSLGKPDDDLELEQDMSETSAPDTQDPPTPPKIRSTPTNFLLVSKNGVAIQGQYFLDLSIPPAPQFVSDAVSGTENLSLYTTNGAITADVWATGNNKSKRVSMKLCSDNGNIRAKVYDVFCNGESEHRLSLNIELRANYGDVSLSLPRHFRGPITIRTSHERIAFSPALEKHMAPVSDVQGVRVYFVGDRPRSGRWRGNDDDDEESEEDTSAGGPPEEPLDELSVGGSHTGVRIQCHGEPELPPMPQNGWENFCMGTVRFFKSGRIS